MFFMIPERLVAFPVVVFACNLSATDIIAVNTAYMKAVTATSSGCLGGGKTIP